MASRPTAKSGTKRKGSPGPNGGIDLVSLIEQFGSEDKCHAYLASLRWPKGVRCPRCGFDKISRIVKRRQFDCDSCRYQFSVRVDTILMDSKLPLWKWFLASYLMCESRKGISANQLSRTIKVSYKTAWYLCHRIRAAMTDGAPEQLAGTVEVDEHYVGGKASSGSKKAKGRQDKADKTMVLGAIERSGPVRLKVSGSKTATKAALHAFVDETISDEDVERIMTDQHPSYLGIPKHESVDHSAEEWVRGEVHTNSVESVWSLFQRSLIGSYHHLSVKHLPAYLDEFSFRFNNRENPYLFRDTLLRLIGQEPLSYKQLTS